MAPSFVRLSLAALACASAVAAQQTYQVEDEYNPSNFFDKWDFWASNQDPGKPKDVDPTEGYVNYRNRADAEELGIISNDGKEVRLGVNGKGTYTHPLLGRDSVRLQSKGDYKHGLFIADFTHFPNPTCGSWPAFWMNGADWPSNGEFDIYEPWNLDDHNSITLHTDRASVVGACTIPRDRPDLMSGTVRTSNCDHWFEDTNVGQWNESGCSVMDKSGRLGDANGGVYALEWTAEHYSVWSWPQGSVPQDIQDGTPDPSKWGTPTFHLGPETCNIEGVMARTSKHKMIINISLCGTPGKDSIWGESCAAKTGMTCNDYVANNPAAFEEVFFGIRSIKVYNLKDIPAPPPPPPPPTTSSESQYPTTTDATTSSTSTEGETYTSTTADTTASETGTTISETLPTSIDTTVSETGTTISETMPTSTDTTASETGTTMTTTFSSSSSSSTSTSSWSNSTSSTSSSTGPSITKTITTTTTRTITSCKPTVTKCPYGSTTVEEVVYTTVCPADEHGAGSTTTSRTTVKKTTTAHQSKPTYGSGCQGGGSCSGGNNSTTSGGQKPGGKNNTPPTTVNSGGRAGVSSLGLAAVGLAVFFFGL